MAARTYRKPRVIDGRTIPYTPVEWAYFDDGHVARMRPPAWAVLQYLMRCATASNECDATASEIAERTGLSRQGVLTARDRLVELGYIQIHESGGGRGRGTVYLILPLQTAPKAPTTLTVSDEAQEPKVSTTLTQSANDVDSLRQRGLQFSESPLVPPYKELQKAAAEGDVAAASAAPGVEDPAALLVGAGVDPATARRLVTARGQHAAESVRIALRNAEILEARQELRSTKPAYIVRAVESCYAALPEPAARPTPEQTREAHLAAARAAAAQRARAEALRRSAQSADRESLETLRAMPADLVERLQDEARQELGEFYAGREWTSSPILRARMLELAKREEAA